MLEDVQVQIAICFACGKSFSKAANGEEDRGEGDGSIIVPNIEGSRSKDRFELQANMMCDRD